jgi:serine/threonine protein kinase
MTNRLNVSEPQKPLATAPCPDVETLRSILAGTMTVAEQVIDHLNGCLACQSRLDSLSDSQTLAEYREHVRRPAGEHDLEEPLMKGDLGSLDGLAIESEIGRGGMGVVFRARDDKLGRILAVKVLPRGCSADSDFRFERETKAAARINHPHVVPLYFAGRSQHGRPYLVMPLVEGDSLKARLADGPLPSTEAARIVQQVATGLAAAHAADLIHRDVKPANILLEHSTNSAKLTDFGLVRSAGDETLTRANVVCGTPAYMSPEQIADPISHDARGDIYSLGVVLYECLTGTPPFLGMPTEIMDQHRWVEVVPPRRLNRAVPLDMQNICLKALSKSPGQRYQTATEFADDLERFQQGQPVLARETPAWRKARLWAQRNPVLTLALASTVGSLLLGTIVSSMLWLQSAASARQSQELADQLRVNQGKLQTALQTSESQRLVAENRFDELRTLANELLFEIYPEVEFLENSLAARQAIVTSALDYLDRLNQESSNDAQLQAELATAYEKVGELYGMIGNNHLGDKEAGLQHYLKGQQLRKLVWDADPTSPTNIERLAHNYYVVARTQWMNDQIAESEQAFQDSLALQRTVVQLEPDSAAAKNKLATILIDYANIPAWNDEHDAATRLLGEAQELLNELIASDSANGEYKKTLSRLLRALSKVQTSQETPDAGEETLVRAIQLGEQLIEIYPNDFPVARSHWISQYYLAEHYIKHKVAEKVIPACQAAIDFPKTALANEPENALIAVDLSNCYFNLARAYRLNDDFERSITEARNAAAVTETLVAAHPSDNEYQRNLAIQLTEIARGYLQLMQYEKVIEPAAQAIAILDRLDQAAGEANFYHKYDLSIAYRVEAQAHHQLGHRALAIKAISSAIESVTAIRESGHQLAGLDELLKELADEKAACEQSGN